MTKLNYRIIFDITTLSLWTRPPVGIVRTQLELAKYLLSTNTSPVLFIRFSPDRSKIEPLNVNDIKQIISQLDNPEKAFDKTDSKTPSKAKQFNVKLKAKGIVKKLIPVKFHGKLAKAKRLYQTQGKKTLLYKVLEVYAPALYLRFKPLTNNVFKSQFNPSFFLAQNGHEFLGKNDVFVSTGLDWDQSNYELLYWLKKRIGFKFVGIFYDAISSVMPQFSHSTEFPADFFNHFYNLNYLADKVHCISNFSKTQYIETCNQHQMKILPKLKTIYLGDNPRKTKNAFKADQPVFVEPYALYVSTIESRKNHEILLKAWLLAMTQKKTMPKLICVGMFGWGTNDLFKLYEKNSYLQEKVEFKHNVSDEELVTLYQNACFCLFPSFMEGWGLGAAESLTYGKACIVSTAPALIEATQGLMPSIDPLNSQAWVDIISKMYSDLSYRTELENRIKSDFNLKTWEKFSSEFFEFSLDFEMDNK